MSDETRERLKREGWILWMKCRPVLDACRPPEDALEALRSEEEEAQVARLRPLHQTPLDWPDDR